MVQVVAAAAAAAVAKEAAVAGHVGYVLLTDAALSKVQCSKGQRMQAAV
jgi:hypothetical protein